MGPDLIPEILNSPKRSRAKLTQLVSPNLQAKVRMSTCFKV